MAGKEPGSTPTSPASLQHTVRQPNPYANSHVNHICMGPACRCHTVFQLNANITLGTHNSGRANSRSSGWLSFVWSAITQVTFKLYGSSCLLP